MKEVLEKGFDTGAPEGPAPETLSSRRAGLESASPSSPRRAYSAPQLHSLGRLSRVTRFGGSEIVDSGSGLGQAL